MTRITSQDTSVVHLRTMALGFVAGPLTWGVYFLAGYVFIEAACKSDFLRFSFLGLSGISVVILGLTFVAFLVVLFAGWWAYGKWREARPESTTSAGDGPFEIQEGELAEGHIRFMTFVGLLLSGLFAIVILLTGLAVFFLQPC